MLNSTSTNLFGQNQDQLSSSSRSSWFNHICQSLVHYFGRGHEPRVWQKRNADGDVFYRAYDPYTGRSTYLTSDTDLRAWLEQLPYQ